jgi:hypothetical protein
LSKIKIKHFLKFEKKKEKEKEKIVVHDFETKLPGENVYVTPIAGKPRLLLIALAKYSSIFSFFISSKL